jgi:uncharacterized protein involved in exopolysaccharide biosynthesis
MSRLLRIIVWLYPADWRRRYQCELEALLDDLPPGWPRFLDLFREAVTMRIQGLAALPVLCALTGTIAAAALAFQQPTLYAASATSRLMQGQAGNAPQPMEVMTAVKTAWGEMDDAKRRNVEVILDPSRTVATLTYRSADPADAQRVAQQLSTAMVTSVGGELLSSPHVPQSTVPANYSPRVAAGAVAGFAGGAVAALILWWRKTLSDF